jgi:DNA invertase Pin-like site-specific DNA recombinase
MIACYIRVSSKDQKTDSQKSEIKAWLKNHRIKAKDVTWFEDTFTRRTLKRPALDKLQKAIFDGKIKTVIVWKVDRLAGTQKDGINLLAQWCEKEIRVISVTQQIDLSGPTGRMVAGLLFSLSEIELVRLQERQAAGIAVAKKRGVYTGRKQGTTKGKPERAKQLRKQGLTFPEIANAMNISESTAKRYVKT